jgi:chromosome segregation ATPase
MRLKRIVIDSKFPVMVANVLSQSRDRHITTDTLSVFSYLVGLEGEEFFDVLVSGFVTAGGQNSDQRIDYERTMASDRETIRALREVEKKNEEELTALRGAYASLTGEFQEEKEKSESREEDRSPDLNQANLEAKIIKLKAECQASQTLVKQLREDNQMLMEKLTLCTQANKEQTEVIDRHVRQKLEDLATQNYALREAEDRLESAERKRAATAEEIVKLDNELRSAKFVKEKTDLDLEKIRRELEYERKKIANLEGDVERLSKENEKFRRIQKEINHVKRKYAAKKRNLEDQVIEATKEKDKWQALAKFKAKIRKHKFEAAQEVYSVIY